jgi:hypothetical protein
MSIDKKALAQAASEMNEVMGLKPKISLGGTKTELQAAIIKNAIHPKDGVVADDEFSQETWAVLAALEVPVAMGVVGIEAEVSEAGDDEPSQQEIDQESAEAEMAEAEEAAEIRKEEKAAAKGKAKGNGKAKAAAAPAAEKPAAAPAADKPGKDEFGFRMNSNKHHFALAIKKAGKKGITMADVRELPWNTNKAAYPSTLKELKDGGYAKVTDGRIYFVD